MAYETSTAKIEELAMLGGTPAGAVTWAPGIQEGYVSHSTSICAGIARVTRKGAERIPGPVTFDGHTWAVDFTWFRDASAECTADGRVVHPILRKDGKGLLVFASPTSQGCELLPYLSTNVVRARHVWWLPGAWCRVGDGRGFSR
ncbi:hypothetical protein [Catellatospora sichuanensis]|uniref:hypothetical protein n=1 Tax=Catellatospora sichuanensis TaxID=1969805 RepID=UPI001183E2D0|nr:hypothetical protein [Catellatospora sichuanensis]